MDTTTIEEVMGGIALVAIAVYFVYWHFFGGECPECGRTHAIDTTGETTKGDLDLPDLEEWKCKYCGHRMWEKKESPGGYGGGGGE